ncbi:MAG: hypothetical protein NZ895_05660 [Archaeoglobaceae archaeon]|nr:hypothetical protein [Archaeoglobaceae archaeon]MCX8151793.1 hypothetical protein [Archaeoglobaceae archaeon]MDW8013181.1 hypothetical protein [Archaeoglobaceae archaeon]
MKWLVALMLLLLVFGAQGLKIEEKAREGPEKRNIEIADKRYEEVKKKMENVKKEKDQRKILSTQVEVTKRLLERLEARVENLNLGEETKNELKTRINNLKTQLDFIAEKINSAREEELKEIAKELRSLMKSVNSEVKEIIKIYTILKLEENLERLKQVRDRLEAYANTSKLDKTIEQIEKSLDEMKKEGKDNTKQINELFKKAFIDIKEILRENRLGHPLGYESGFLYAKVDGKFSLLGNFSLVQIKGNGTVGIKGDVVRKVEKKDGVLIIAKGIVEASGEGKFRIIAHGSGQIVLDGAGYYRIKEVPKVPVSDEKEFKELLELRFGL